MLVVCTGNVCRSAMAQGVLASLLPDVPVSSAGVSALPGYPVDHYAVATMRESLGIDISAHRARRLILPMCEYADLILVMELGQKRSVERAFGPSRGKVYCFDPAEDVADPRGRSRPMYDVCLTQILAGAQRWVNRIRAL